jgi:hypothetical protein
MGRNLLTQLLGSRAELIVNPNAQLKINSLLESGESLIWAGVPRQGLLLRASDVFMIPFSLLWGGFAIFWELSVIDSGAPFWFSIWGIPFVLVGLYLIIGRFFVDARSRANTAYGLTDRRVIIVSGITRKSTKSLPLRTLTDISLTERGDGSGTILLGPQQPFASWYAGMQWPGMGQHLAPGFELINDAKQVHHQLLEAQRLNSRTHR